MNRRGFLQALGLGGASLAFGRAAWSDDASPRRLIVISSTQGTVPSGCTTNPAGLPEEVPWSQDLTGIAEHELAEALRPLWAHRDRMLVLDGVSMISAELDAAGDRHQKGWLHAWTGSWADFRGGSLAATAPSLDQLVARAIARPDRLPSLELSVLGGRPVCHAGAGQQLPLEEDPSAVWARLFGGGSGPLAGARGSVLDFVLGEYDALAPSLATADRARLDDHMALVRQLELRLAGMAQAGCEGPEPLASFDHRTRFEAHAELVAAAFACDLTRVATISLGDVPTAELGLTGASGDIHADYAHAVHESPAAAAAMIAHHRYQAAEVAALVRALEAVPEGDGTLMDHTLIVWGNEVGDGWHGYHRTLPVLIGGGWSFSTGRVVHWPWNSVPVPMAVPGGRSAGAGIPHNRVLVGAARAMGLDVDHVGLASIPDAEVPLDLSGSLQELS
ncbi:MAG: DUF1552 domain-containing protein [Alphaproteobacteria bacterium]|nr:DUF1552 domain-containing protein [Alphaproteobacteria bacterium]